MVHRIYVEKKAGLAHEASALQNDIINLLGISSLKSLRLLNRYDVENIEKELFDYSVKTVFSEPQLDNVSSELAVGDETVLQLSISPVSLTREQTLRLSVSRLFLRKRDRLSVLQEFISLRVS